MNTEKDWNTYLEEELKNATNILTKRGYTLDTEQKHIGGERFLMQAVTTTSGKKLILSGISRDDTKVIIKAASTAPGKRELSHERDCRHLLTNIDFAAEVFFVPEELDFFEEKGILFSIQKYIHQPCAFIERPLEEQFSYALTAFKAQEGAHATTDNHLKAIKRAYEVRTAKEYTQRFSNFMEVIDSAKEVSNETKELLKRANQIIVSETENINRYGQFLTHTDFVPHNFRIDTHGTMYLLDYSSLVFGNKYEGWARFLNFMTLYNPALEKALSQYVCDNRTKEEHQSLHIMRLYRLGEIITYYHGTLVKCDGNLYALNTARIHFWSEVLRAQLEKVGLPESIRQEYMTLRDSLRSESEKKRQVGLH